jgi:hypothetical protein
MSGFVLRRGLQDGVDSSPSNERKQPERAWAIFAAQVLANRWTLAEEQPAVIDLH